MVNATAARSRENARAQDGKFGEQQLSAPEVTLGGSADSEPYKFNNDYDNKEQVRRFYPAYAARRAELDAAGLFPYNDRFVGQIDGLEAVTPKDEGTAIYLLQLMHDRDAEDAREEEFLASGGVVLNLDELDTHAILRGTFVHRNFYVGGNGWTQYDEARLLVSRGLGSVLPKGKRTHGFQLHTGRILYRPTAKK